MPRNKYPEETIEKILNVSKKLFIEKGYEQTTVLDIVDNLGGLTRGAFYHHFKSKEEVLLALVERSNENIGSPFTQVMQMDMPNGLERLKYALKQGLRLNIENEERSAIIPMLSSLLSNPRFLAEHIRGIQDDAKQFTLIVEEGMADGSLKPGNAKLLSELFFILVNIWALPNLFPCDSNEMIEKVEMIDQIFNALGYDFTDEEMGELFTNVLEKLKDPLNA